MEQKATLYSNLTAALGVTVFLHALFHKLHNFIGGVNVEQSITGKQEKLIVFRYSGYLRLEI